MKLVTIISVIILTALLYVLAVIIFGYPLVLDFSSNSKNTTTTEYAIGDTIKVFKSFDFNQGEWKAYIFIDPSDKQSLSRQLNNSSVLVSEDIHLFKKMQEDWKFIYSGGDIATVTSQIVLVRNGKKVFSSGIILENAWEALQSGEYGHLEGRGILINSCQHFKKAKAPVIILI